MQGTELLLMISSSKQWLKCVMLEVELNYGLIFKIQVEGEWDLDIVI